MLSMALTGRTISTSAAVLTAALGVFGGAAWGQTSSLHRPVRLTAGDSVDMMGEASPSGSTVVFVSNRNSTSELWALDKADGGATLLVDDWADALAPRFSPDGRLIAYISYREDATGDICLLDTDTGDRQCLPRPSTSEVEVHWLSTEVLLALVRPELHGDYALMLLSARDGAELGQVAKNTANGNLSHDRSWFVYVPVERTRERVGVQFALRAAGRIAAVRLDGGRPIGEPIEVDHSLPGASGFPAFSRDGGWLYFSQFLNDTNLDGKIDGNDNSVLFRAKWPIEAPTEPEQLTSAEWNCQYPAPSAHTLLATCAISGSLDVFELPLTGAVPEAWGAEELWQQAEAARNPWEKLLLLGHRLSHALPDAERRDTLLEMIRLHLALSEYQSAAHYAAELAGTGGDAPSMAAILGELVALRREEGELTRGLLSGEFLAAQQARLVRLHAAHRRAQTSAKPDLEALAMVVVSEAQDAVGNEDEAWETLRAIQPKALTTRLEVELYADRALALLTLRHEVEALLGVYAGLTTHEGLSESDRMRWADRYARLVVRGVGGQEALARVRERQAGLDERGSLAARLALEAELLQMRPDKQDSARKAIFDVYKKNRDPARRKALVLEVAARAAARGCEKVLYETVNTWVSGLSRDSPERRFGEEIYRQTVLERAYDRRADGEFADSRGLFFGVTRQALALEAHVGFVEARALEGATDVADPYAEPSADAKAEVIQAFVRAQKIARTLDDTEVPAAQLVQIQLALDDLTAVAQAAPNAVEVQFLRGHLLLRRFFAEPSSQHAAQAYETLAVALDLAQRNPRYRAATLSHLTALQSAVGNHYRARVYAEERMDLPFASTEAELAARLALARARYHSRSGGQALVAGLEALDFARSRPELGRYVPMAAHAAAIYALARAEHAKAAAMLEEALAGLSGDQEQERYAALLGLASARLGLGRPAECLGALDELDSLEAPPAPLDEASAGAFSPRDAALLSLGLRAEAYAQLSDWELAAQAWERRYGALRERLATTGLPSDHDELARTAHHLSVTNAQLGDADATAQWLERGLTHAKDYLKAASVEISTSYLQIVGAWAQWCAAKPCGARLGPIERELDVALERLAQAPDTRTSHDRGRLQAARVALELRKRTHDDAQPTTR